MSKDTGSGGGLLSKVVKFVTSPTTHWSDLDRPEGEGDGNTESRLALKEMIERKRRNDFVRNREFDMLRKLRRRERMTEGEIAALGPSFYSSSQSLSSNTGERARTLEKIDEIEAQMTTSWFKRQADGTAAPHVPPPAEHDVSDTAYAKTAPTPLTVPEPGRPSLHDGPPRPPRAFDPTEPMPALPAASAPLAPAASAPIPAVQPDSAPEAPASHAVVAFGGAADFNVEVLVETRHDPEIEEVAIRFANGDTAGAEAGLLDLLSEGSSRRDDVDTWLTLFDLYRASGDQIKFDDAALEFAARFGRSAPQWALVTERVTTPAPMQPAATAPAAHASLFHWVCPSTVGTQSVATLNAALARAAQPWRIDWRYLKTIEPAALPALADAFKRWGSSPVQIRFLGVDRLLQVLAEKSPTDDRTADPQWWGARLALLRVLDEMDEFELVALNYCVTYEVSPPAWENPLNTYGPLNEEGQTQVPSDFAGLEDDPLAQPSAAGPLDSMPAALAAAEDTGIVHGRLEGELIGSADAALKPLETAPSSVTVFELNCRRLTRVDFGAAGDLLNWTMALKATGRSVTFKQVNRLVAAFFGVVGINESARILLRVD